MLKKVYCVIVKRVYEYDTFEFDEEPTEKELTDILKEQKEGSFVVIEERYKLV